MAIYQSDGQAKNLQQQKRRSSSYRIGEQVGEYSDELNVPEQFEIHKAEEIAAVCGPPANWTRENIISCFKGDGEKKP